MELTMDNIAKHYERAREEAWSLIELRARRILMNNRHLYEFIMAMGSAFFIDTSGETVYGSHSEPIDEILREWDADLKLTGEPMRFTATGPKRTDW